jgi:hypothetical protein
MPRRTRQHRTQVDRAGIRELTGASFSTIAHWYRRRAETGFPEPVETDRDGRDWWWLDEVSAFWSRYQADRAAAFTTVDRSGDPDDLLTAPQAARVLGYKDHRSLTPALLDHPDRVEELPSGRLRRSYYRRTVWEHADSRPLRHSTGRPPGTTAPQRQPHWYADDPRLDLAIVMVEQAHAAGASTYGLGSELARQLDVSHATGKRLIATALKLRPPPARA